MKYENGQDLFIAATGQAVKVIAKTEFFDGRQARYCVETSEGSIFGKNMPQDWINEDKLTAVAPKNVADQVSNSATLQGKKGVRDMKIRDIKKG